MSRPPVVAVGTRHDSGEMDIHDRVAAFPIDAPHKPFRVRNLVYYNIYIP
jgi:hypothetical protein